MDGRAPHRGGGERGGDAWPSPPQGAPQQQAPHPPHFYAEPPPSAPHLLRGTQHRDHDGGGDMHHDDGYIARGGLPAPAPQAHARGGAPPPPPPWAAEAPRYSAAASARGQHEAAPASAAAAAAAAFAAALPPLFASADESRRLHDAQDAMLAALVDAQIARETAELAGVLAQALAGAADDARRLL
jgi:hypothetical protein